MTKEEFKKELKELNLNQTEFAKICRLSKETILNWNDTTRPIPKWIKPFLKYYKLANKGK